MRDAEAMIFKTQNSSSSIGMELLSESYSSGKEISVSWINHHLDTTLCDCRITRYTNFITRTHCGGMILIQN